MEPTWKHKMLPKISFVQKRPTLSKHGPCTYGLMVRASQKGNILDTSGKIIGQHDGIINFTIGQRKGIGISHKEPLYVVEINSKENEVIVGKRKDLLIKKIFLKNINILDKKRLLEKNLFIKVRSTGRLIKSKTKLLEKHAEVYLQEEETGISPGQACVFYSKDKVGDKILGGGWIASTENSFLSPKLTA